MEQQNELLVCYKQTNEEEWDTVRHYVHVEAKYWYGWKEEHWIRNEIRQHFREACACMHDCCGHWHGGAFKIRRIGKWTYIVNLMYSRNY